MNTPDYRSIHRAILNWYEANGRKELPWRNTTDAYAIYVSEIMLQQTQVKTVLERFYFPFLERFPTLQSLSEAPQEAVLKKWEGLGYYTRARNLHACAKLAAPSLPKNIDALLALPGIGKNTAHAIAAFAYHQPVAIMEANVKRILCRFFAMREPIEKTLWKNAHQLLDKEQPFIYNQAMMDIGATICTPKTPKCDICPLEAKCQGKKIAESFPQPKSKKTVKIRKKVIVVFQNTLGEFYIYQRNTRFLNGLYGFFEYDTLPRSLKSNTHKIGVIKQIYSHFTLSAEVYLTTSQPESNQGEWHLPKKLSMLALSKADHKIIALLDSHLSKNTSL